MTEEVQDEVVENEEIVEDKEKEVVDPFRERALEMGWNPDFEGDPADFVDAKEFVRRKPIFDKIEATKRELKETQKALKVFQEHYNTVKKTEYARALSDLQVQKKQALVDGDADALIEIDDKISDIKTEEKIAQQQRKEAATQPDPRFVKWAEANDWYTKDEELRAVADEVGTARNKLNLQKSPGDQETPEEMLEYVVKRVKKLYPEKFTNPNKSRPSSVEGGSNNTPTRETKSSDDFELDEEERKVMNTFVRAGLMTKEQYIADLKGIKGAKK